MPTLLAGNALAAAVYFFAAKFGLSLAFVNQSATAVWPPTGISLVLVLFFGRRYLPGIFIGALTINYAVGGSFFIAAGIALGNTLEALIAAWGVRRFAGGREAFQRSVTVFRYVPIVAFSAVVSASIGLASLRLAGAAAADESWPIWYTWWTGDFVSALVVAPFLIVWARFFILKGSYRRAGEAAALVLGAVLVGQTIFGGWYPGPVKNYPLQFLCMPFLVWAAYRLCQKGAVTGVFILAALAVRGTLAGYGPFSMGGPHESLLLLQAFLGTIALVSLSLASLAGETADTRRQLEESLKEVRAVSEGLARSNRELEQFAYVASHDLQEPVRKIINYGERLRDRAAGLRDEEKDFLARMCASAERMRMVIQDLLTFSRVSHEAAFETVELSAIVKEVLSDVELLIQQSRAAVEVRGGPIRLHANPAHMRHLFQNLLTNAVKFRREAVPPRITIEMRPVPGAVEISVADNGIGFDEKYKEKIFRPFQRLHSRDRYEGTGIGLAIVQKIVQTHSGDISVQSRPGEGTTFTLRFPKTA